MKTIGEYVGHTPDPRSFQPGELFVDGRCAMGVEFEIENLDNFSGGRLKTSFVQMIKDGSLRNGGREFILGARNAMGQTLPVNGKDLEDGLLALDNALKGYEDDGYERPQCTERTSVHLHLDVRDLEWPELQKFVGLYTIFEDVLFRYAGEDRKASAYCKPIGRTSSIRENLGVLLTRDVDALGGILEQADKYDGLNLEAVKKFGSIEIRIHRGTTDIREVIEWINVIQSLKIAAKSGDISLHELPELVSSLGLMNFFNKVFVDCAVTLDPYADEMSILQGVRVVQDLIHQKDFDRETQHYQFSKKGSKSKNDSILHKFAAKHDRKVYTN